WLGRRLVLGHSQWFLGDACWTSIVSSRLGRYGRLLADWPLLLGQLLRAIQRSGSVYLSVPGTTVAPLVHPLLARSAVPCVQVDLPAVNEHDWTPWLAAKLHLVDNDQPFNDRQLYLSPPLSPAADDLFERWPLQDRVAIGCAQRVRALMVRPEGTIAHLLAMRLAEQRFGTGSVWVWMPSATERGSATGGDGAAANRAEQSAWLERGAVGWYVPPREQLPAPLGCRQRSQAETALWQPISKLALWHSDASSSKADQPLEASPRYLVHCVRGARGALPPDAAMDWIEQAWMAGHVPEESPLVTLENILASGVLRGRAALNRTDKPCVSFSAVPVDQLIQRRSFQPHLGRWDWEPFGLLIQRQALERFGARPVIYGDEATYRRLSPEDRPFFQPASRRSRLRQDWTEECEWRVVGDVRLSDLPRSAVGIFVAYEHQAQALASHCPWPVIWLQDAQTPAQPAPSKRQRRKEVRTSRN
ncbi:MAG: hypothetical protein ACTHK7_12275, partial [Aureliella sp.]